MNRRLSSTEFDNNNDMFTILEIEKQQAVGQNYDELSKYLKKQHYKLALKHHPDKTKSRTEEKFNQIYTAYNSCKEYIEPLNSGCPCVKISKSGYLTKRDFHYRNKLFTKLNITEMEAVQKTPLELIYILQDKGKLESNAEIFSSLIFILQNQDNAGTKRSNYNKTLNEHFKKSRSNFFSAEPSIQLLSYIAPLVDKQDPISGDKSALATLFMEFKNLLVDHCVFNPIRLCIVSNIIIGCYLSWWIIAFTVVNYSLIKTIKCQSSRIFTDKFTSKIGIDKFISKIHVVYAITLAVFSAYLVATNFIANGLTIGGVILGSLITLTIVSETLNPVYAKCCTIYVEKHVSDLLEGDSRTNKETETNLLEWYDPRRLLVPIICIPIVRLLLVPCTNALAERNTSDEVSTSNMPTTAPQLAITQLGISVT